MGEKGERSVQVRSILGWEVVGCLVGKSAGPKNAIFCVTVYEVGAVGLETRGQGSFGLMRGRGDGGLSWAGDVELAPRGEPVGVRGVWCGN